MYARTSNKFTLTPFCRSECRRGTQGNEKRIGILNKF